MKAVVQRVLQASVAVDGQVISRIERGLLTLIGIERGDSSADLEKLIERVLNLRIFEDVQGKMNQSLVDIGGEHLIVSQFTLAADYSSGRRPSFTRAEEPGRAEEMYNEAIRISAAFGVKTLGGKFRADMKVSLINDGPVTFVLNSGD